MRSYFEARGADPFTALHQAYAAIDGMVRQQAALLSHLYEFKLFGIVFLIMLPLILMMRRRAMAAGR